MNRWGSHPAFYALQPVNEPSPKSDLGVLKDYYRKSRDIMLKYNSEALFVFHDAFLSDAKTWEDTFSPSDYDLSKIVLDTHKYLAWTVKLNTIEDYCDAYGDMFKDCRFALSTLGW